MKFLICSNGSESAEKAVKLGSSIAAACQAEVTLLGIVEAQGDGEKIISSLRRAQELLVEKQIQATLVTKSGDPIQEIVKITEESQYDLVVIGAARKEAHGLFWVSSKTYKIIKSVNPPVLAVMEKTNAIKKILICTGGKKYIDNAIKLTGQVAKGMGASVTLFNVMPEPPILYSRLRRMKPNVETVLNSRSELSRNLLEEKQTLEALGVPTEIHLRQGMVIVEIFREINNGNYDLVVTGSSLSRGALHTYVLGNITREIVNRTNCAVLVVRSGIKSAGITQSLVSWFDRVAHRTHAQQSSKGK